MSPKVQSPKSKGLGPRSVVKSQLGYALDASARNGARLWSKTQPQRLADAKDVGTTPRAAAGAPHTAALRSANLRQVHSPNSQWPMLNRAAPDQWLVVQLCSSSAKKAPPPLPMNLRPRDHPLTPSLSPSEGERVPEGAGEGVPGFDATIPIGALRAGTARAPQACRRNMVSRRAHCGLGCA